MYQSLLEDDEQFEGFDIVTGRVLIINTVDTC